MIEINKYLMGRKNKYDVLDYKLVTSNEFFDLSDKEKIRKIISIEGFLEAIAVSSPTLHREVKRLEKKKDKEIRGILRSVLKYYIRMCTRMTPFGLNSSASVFNFSTYDSVQTKEPKIICQVSEMWKAYLIETLLENNKFLTNVELFTNPIILRQNKIRNFSKKNHSMSSEIISIENNQLNKWILRFFENGNCVETGYEELKQNIDGLSIEIYMKFIRDLISKDFLKNKIIEDNNLEDLYNQMVELDIYPELRNLIDEIFTVESNFRIEKFLSVTKESQKIFPKVDVFHIDLVNDELGSINNKVEESLISWAKVNYLISEMFTSTEELSEYSSNFLNKYGYNTGIEIKELLYKKNQVGNFNFNHVTSDNKKLYNFFLANIFREYSVLKIDNFISEKLKNFEISKPASVDYYFRVHEDEKGEITIFPSGSEVSNDSHKVYGRFLNFFDKEISREIIKNKAESTKKMFPDHEIVDVNYSPTDYRSLNVMKNPIIHEKSINFTHSTGDINLENLYLYSDENMLEIRDVKSDKNCYFTVSNMLNYYYNSPEIVDFIMNISSSNRQEIHPISRFDNEFYMYTPRIEFDNIVLSLKKWKYFLHNNNVIKAIEKDYEKGKIERYLNLVNEDNYILIDLESEVCKNILSFEIKRKKDYIVLEEANHIINNRSLLRNYEFVTQLQLYSKKNNNKFTEIKLYDTEVKRELSIYDHMLYIKIYVDTLYESDLLKYIDQYFKDFKIDKYFFIRYYDTKKHIRLRIFSNNEINSLFKFLKEIDNLDYVSSTSMDKYEQELERYGGKDNITYVEDIFMADSSAVLENINLVNEDKVAYSFLWCYKIFELFFEDVTYETKKHFFNSDDKINYYKDYRENIKNINLEDLSSKIDEIMLQKNIPNKIGIFKSNYLENMSVNNLVEIVFSLMHMSYNRIGIDNDLEVKINEFIKIKLKEEQYKSNANK